MARNGFPNSEYKSIWDWLKRLDARVSAVARDTDFRHLWRQLGAARWTSKRPRGLESEWSYVSPDRTEVFVGEQTVVVHAFQSGLIEDDNNDVNASLAPQTTSPEPQTVISSPQSQTTAPESDLRASSGIPRAPYCQFAAQTPSVVLQTPTARRAPQTADTDKHGQCHQGADATGGMLQIDSLQLSQTTLNVLFDSPGESEVEFSQVAVPRAFGLTTDDLEVDASQQDAASTLQLLSEAPGFDSDVEQQQNREEAFAPSGRSMRSRIRIKQDVYFIPDGEDTSDCQKFELSETRIPDASNINPLVVQAERRQRISKAQDEELRWADVKAYLKGEFTQLSHAELTTRGRPGKLGELGVTLRLVVPKTMIDEVLQNCHNSIEGGPQGLVRTYHCVKADYYWIGLYADVVKHVQSCEDCSTSKSKPHLKGYSPGNVMSDRPFHVVSMDFVIPLPRTRRSNTALLLFQDNFSGFVIAKAMRETGALETTNQRAIGEVSQDRDPNSANLCGSHLQADWDDIAEKLVHAINISRDSTRQETPFYLVHGWGARSTLKAVTESIRQGQTNPAETSDTAEWRRKPIDKARLIYTSQPSSSVRRRQEGQKNIMKPSVESREQRYRESLGESATAQGPPTESEIPDEPSAESTASRHAPCLKREINWEPDEDEVKHEVEAILDDEIPLSTSTATAQRRFKVKWVGYDEPSWEPLSNLSCGGLLLDYLRNKKRENRLQMVQVADEN
ncbi:unnamed protein product [Phytophthora fragariaefolia]|uniref:Unnamed protein product n=1 Tax=Phytophthora fragariaefolia TaxID=1490495 RepID=A0A9W6TQC9_9STRA|nr:unnamed protein product [Phytophthora fragariaefolia]